MTKKYLSVCLTLLELPLLPVPPFSLLASAQPGVQMEAALI
jgi:hypothetical protein